MTPEAEKPTEVGPWGSGELLLIAKHGDLPPALEHPANKLAREALRLDEAKPDKKEALKMALATVDGPDHYLNHPSGVEPITIVEWLSSSLANVVEYVWRAPHKGEYEKDMKKALWYADREESRLRHHSSEVRVLMLSSTIVERMRKVIAAEPDKNSVLCRVLGAISQLDPELYYEEYHGGVTAPPIVGWSDVAKVRDILREVVGSLP